MKGSFFVSLSPSLPHNGKYGSIPRLRSDGMFFTYLLAFFGICIGSIIIATGFDDSPFFTRFLFKFLGISIFVLSITFVKVRRKRLRNKKAKKT